MMIYARKEPLFGLMAKILVERYRSYIIEQEAQNLVYIFINLYCYIFINMIRYEVAEGLYIKFMYYLGYS